MTFPRCDVFVIGGGPVGLAAAIAARRKGFRVGLADALCPPIDKACGEAILPDGVAAAIRLGLMLEGDSVPIRGIRFHGEGTSVAAEFRKNPAWGIRRTLLHRALAAEAEKSGVELHWGRSIGSFDEIDADWIIGADGSASRVRAWAGLDRFSRDTRRFGFRRHYRVAPWSDHVDIHWGNGCQIYVTPIGAREIGIATISGNPKLRVSEALREFPEIAKRLRGEQIISAERGGITATRKLKRVTRRVGKMQIALIGDASGSIDAISGEGLSLGFQHALVLADAIAAGRPARYEAAHRRLAFRPRFMADLTLTVDRYSWLRKRVFPASAARPELFAGMLAMHVGDAHPVEFAANCIALGWHMLII